ncbi:MAG: glycosyltransferase family 4 protein [Hyphomonadaceae bacterium]|nr:glycosyltransferase family 4 protein [Hyphomonadaceae bacterium]
MRSHRCGQALKTVHVGAVLAGFGAESGGGYTFEREILTALSVQAGASDHRFTVLCPQPAEEALRAVTAGTRLGVASIPRGSGRLGAMLLREVEAVRAHWRRPSAIDTVAATLGVQFVWFLSAQPDRTDLPYMTVVWDLQHRATPWFPEMSARGTWDAREAVHRWFLQRASRIITGTEVGRQQLRGFYQIPDDNILVLPHPTPAYVSMETVSQGDVLEKFGLREPFVMYPAQFWPHKNHANLILALAALKRQGLSVSLALSGSDQGNRAFIGDLAAREGIGDLVHFLGFIERSDLVALYRRALALTYVSWCGPENLPPLEAFALGCPVIASRIPGAEEQLGNAALFCEPGNPMDIASAVAKLNANPDLRQRLIEDGRLRSTRFTPRDYVAGVFDFLDQFETVRRCWP